MRQDELFLSYGVMGGFMQVVPSATDFDVPCCADLHSQPQGHIQVLMNILRGFNVQEALDAPRFCINAGLPVKGNSGEAGDVNSAIYLEEGIPPSIVRQLRGLCWLSSAFSLIHYHTGMGHDAHSITGFDREQFGRGQVIERVMDTSGTPVWAAGSDPRADGNAAAQI
jgi:gamma-glutamyltranspeptidase/glutathione hydrolase